LVVSVLALVAFVTPLKFGSSGYVAPPIRTDESMSVRPHPTLELLLKLLRLDLIHFQLTTPRK